MKVSAKGAVKVSVAVVAAALIAGGAGVAIASTDSNASSGNGFPFSHEPPNVGQVETQVKDYYGGTVDAQGHNHASEHSDWGRDTARAASDAQNYLSRTLRFGHVHNPSIVLDVDDTSQVTYGWEVDNQFAYDAAKNEAAINANEFPAITPTLHLAQWAAAHGVKVFFLTGRPEHQRAATLTDLASDGYPKPAAAYLKWETATPPSYIHCAAAKCTTTEYKSQTRAYIESQGNHIVLNLGDQFSDLNGGHADKAVKLPNPMYYLP